MFRCALILFIAVLPGYSLAAASECEVEEYMRMMYQGYNDLLCSGERYFRLGIYDKAVEQFLQAAETPFPEVPNYKLNARIAHTYLLMGNLERAHHFLVRSKIALSVLDSIYACGDYHAMPSPPPVTDNYGRPITSEASSEVSQAMCGDLYEMEYHPKRKKLWANIMEGKLVEYHYRVARLVAEALTLSRDEVYPYGGRYPSDATPLVTLRGVVTKERKLGYPGYGKTPEKDRVLYVYVLTLEQPITVGTPDTLNFLHDIPMVDVSTVELTFSSYEAPEFITRSLGETVVVQGSFYDPELSEYYHPLRFKVR